VLYVPCVSVMGGIARETSRSWMTFSIFWGLYVAYSLATLFYQAATFSEHPAYSGGIILIVLIFNAVVLTSLRKARSRVSVHLQPRNMAECCEPATGSDCH